VPNPRGTRASPVTRARQSSNRTVPRPRHREIWHIAPRGRRDRHEESRHSGPIPIIGVFDGPIPRKPFNQPFETRADNRSGSAVNDHNGCSVRCRHARRRPGRSSSGTVAERIAAPLHDRHLDRRRPAPPAAGGAGGSRGTARRSVDDRGEQARPPCGPLRSIRPAERHGRNHAPRARAPRRPRMARHDQNDRSGGRDRKSTARASRAGCPFLPGRFLVIHAGTPPTVSS